MMPIEAIAETNVAPSPDGYVYMLYSAGLIKIGFTHDPVARFDGMRSMHASPISLIWLSTGTTDREREMPHPDSISDDIDDITQGDDITPIVEVFRGPTRYAVRFAVSDGEDFAGYEHEIKDTEAEAEEFLKSLHEEEPA